MQRSVALSESSSVSQIENKVRFAGSHGMTLIEMLVVMSLITAASLFAFSSLQPYAIEFRVRGAAGLVAAELSRARQEAVRTRLCHFFVPLGSNQFRIVRDPLATPNCQYDAGDTVLRTISLGGQYPGVTFSTGGVSADPYGNALAAATPSNIRFEPRGLVTSTGGSTLVLDSLDAAPVAITVTAAGTVRTWTYRSTGWH